MLRKIFFHFSLSEKIATILLSFTIVFCSGQVVWAFYSDNSTVIPSEGGLYREGIVGQLQLINPLLGYNNDVDRDISRLIFAGLKKYNPETKKIEDDLATHTLSRNKKVYTFTLKDELYWHDGEKVTADDVIFTYRDVIQNADFPIHSLKEAFKDIEIKKIDDKTVTFTLQQPYKFFHTNLTLGLLPKHIFSDIPVSKLYLSEFNLSPIGCGPYRFNKLTKDNNILSLHLDRFKKYHAQKPYIERLVIKIFKTEELLLDNIDDLDGIHNVRIDQQDIVERTNRFQIYPYQLNQYVAIFFNLESSKLKNVKTRLGLQLATNKQELVNAINQKQIIDTPLLEISQNDWQYQFDPVRAAGAFFDSEWKIPEVAKQARLGDVTDNNREGNTTTGSTQVTKTITPVIAEPQFISAPNKGQEWITNASNFVIKGSVPEGTKKIIVNNYPLSKFKVGDTDWEYRVNTKYKNITEGKNIYKLVIINKNNEKKEIDKLIVRYISDEIKYQEALAESIKIKQQSETLSLKQEVKPIEKTQSEKEATLKKLSGIIRENSSGEKFELTLITIDHNDDYKIIAENLKKQWLNSGVLLKIKYLDKEKFSEYLEKRDYDLLIFGQNLGYNLDAYPYWHSSQISKNKGLNLSEYKSLEADTLIEEIRATHDEDLRKKSLKDLQIVIRDDVPAIFIYTPTYLYAVDRKIHNIKVANSAIATDRFNNIENWFINMKRQFNKDSSSLQFFPWLTTKF